MSIKRSKLLIFLSILMVATFILIQLIFQKITFLPQLPSFSVHPGDFEENYIDSTTDEILHEKKVSNQLEVSQEVTQSVKASIVIDRTNGSIVAQSRDFDIALLKVDSLGSGSAVDGGVDDSRIEEAPPEVLADQKELKLEPFNPNAKQPQLESQPEPLRPIQVNPAKLQEQKAALPESDLRLKVFQTILWTDFFRQKNYIDESWKSGCNYKNCLFTSNRTSYPQADGILFHAADLNIADLPRPPRNTGQRWIFLNHESPPHTHFQPVASLNGKINWTVTYRLDSDFHLSPSVKMLPEMLPEAPIKHSRARSISWLVSDCKTASNREAYVDELRKYVPVDVYGACGNLTCLPKMSDQCYTTLAENYYFYLAFENSLCPDYVTEKLYNILKYPIVPIVFGGADYKRLAPPNSYIDALSFESPAHLARYLNHLIKTPEEYKTYFHWKRIYTLSIKPYPCQLCEAYNQFNSPKKDWHHLSQWWFEEAPCKRWEKGALVNWKSP